MLGFIYKPYHLHLFDFMVFLDKLICLHKCKILVKRLRLINLCFTRAEENKFDFRI